MHITLYALANYNHGRLVPKTFDLADYRDHDDYRLAVSEWLETVPYPCEPGRFEEEWIVADYEDIPEPFVGEYDLYREFWRYFDQRRELCDSLHEAFDEFYDLFVSGDEDSLPDFSDAYIGHFDSKVEFVEYWLVEVNGFEQYPWADVCIDYEASERVICASHAVCESNRHYFNLH